MASVRKTARHIFVWSYERGTLQYDIICALILAFIFFVPRSCFLPNRTVGQKPPAQKSAPAVQQPAMSDNESIPK
jgi:hypothetical protein